MVFCFKEKKTVFKNKKCFQEQFSNKIFIFVMPPHMFIPADNNCKSLNEVMVQPETVNSLLSRHYCSGDITFFTTSDTQRENWIMFISPYCHY